MLRASTCLANVVTRHLAVDAREASQHGRLPAPDGLWNALQIARGKTDSSEMLTDGGPRFGLSATLESRQPRAAACSSSRELRHDGGNVGLQTPRHTGPRSQMLMSR